LLSKFFEIKNSSVIGIDMDDLSVIVIVRNWWWWMSCCKWWVRERREYGWERWCEKI